MSKPPSDDGHASFVVFHDARGKVFHIHKHVSFSGRHASDKDVEEGARALLGKIGRGRVGARSLLLKDLQLEPGKKYRVDVARGARSLLLKDLQLEPGKKYRVDVARGALVISDRARS